MLKKSSNQCNYGLGTFGPTKLYKWWWFTSSGNLIENPWNYYNTCHWLCILIASPNLALFANNENILIFQTERHFIMQVVCEATQATDVQVKVAALQCLVKIMSLYYQFMESYMGPALFAITLEAMKSDIDEVKYF